MKKKNKIIGCSILALLSLTFVLVGFFNDSKTSNKNNDIFIEDEKSDDINNKKNKEITETDDIKSKNIVVEIKGDVLKPGVYSMANGTRIRDLIDKAGGITENADKDKLPNLAKKLKDEDCIYIKDKNDTSNTAANIASSNSQQNSDSGAVNINTATVEELEKVPGIGPVTAQNIINYREKNGDFKSLEDLKKVGRIGDKTLDKFKDKLCVN